jgi:hypothetical protein
MKTAETFESLKSFNLWGEENILNVKHMGYKYPGN